MLFTFVLLEIGNAEQLREMLENGEMDIAFSGISPLAPKCIEKEFLSYLRIRIMRMLKELMSLSIC